MENITVLGAGGFIGTNLTLALRKKAHLRIIGHDPGHLVNVKSSLPFGTEFFVIDCSCDIDFEQLTRNTDILFHLVSTTRPANSNLDIPRELDENVVFTAKLLESCVKSGVKKVVFFSSGGTVYGVNSHFPLKEDSPMNPVSSYGVQKLAIEKLLYLYGQIHGLDYRIIRLSNPYGPYQCPDGQLGVVAAFIYRMLRGQKIEIYGDGSVVRDFIYIDDAIEGVIKISFSDCGYKIFNLGSGRGRSIKEVLEVIAKIVGKKPEVRYLPQRSMDVPVNYLDTERYESCYGRLIKVGFEEGIRRTCDYIRKEYRL